VTTALYWIVVIATGVTLGGLLLLFIVGGVETHFETANLIVAWGTLVGYLAFLYIAWRTGLLHRAIDWINRLGARP